MPFFARLRAYDKQRGYLKKTHVTVNATVWHAGIAPQPSAWRKIAAAAVAELQAIPQFEIRECTLEELSGVINKEATEALLSGVMPLRAAVLGVEDETPLPVETFTEDEVAPDEEDLLVENPVPEHFVVAVEEKTGRDLSFLTAPPKADPVAPKEEPAAPKEEPAAPKEEPAAPKEEPAAPKANRTPDKSPRSKRPKTGTPRRRR